MIIDDQLIPVIEEALETALEELPHIRGDRLRVKVRERIQRGLDVITNRREELR